MQNVCLITSALTINGRCPYLLYTVPWALSLFTVPYLLYIIRLFRFFSGPVRKYGEVTAESAIVHKDQEEPLGRSRRTGLGPVPAVKDSLDIHGGHLPPPHLDQGSHNIPDHIF